MGHPWPRPNSRWRDCRLYDPGLIFSEPPTSTWNTSECLNHCHLRRKSRGTHCSRGSCLRPPHT
ncbi:MAG: hypothetical protein E6J01_01755 [Chloroflexi bacterium]|nr:MAG: hypothetical protein E6J01_01755 [Chloroflexota bacterium]